MAYTGLQVANVTHVIALAIPIATAILRKQIAYRVRYWILVTILVTLGPVGQASFGLIGQGRFF
jgi:hypothetical protein